MNIISAYRLKYFKIIGLRDGFLCGLKMKKYFFIMTERICPMPIVAGDMGTVAVNLLRILVRCYLGDRS